MSWADETHECSVTLVWEARRKEDKGNMYILGKFQLSEVNYPSVSDFYDNWDRPPNYKLFACPTKNFIHIRFRSIRAAFTRTDGQTTI